MKPVDPDQVSKDLVAVRNLMQSPGWAVLCASHAKGVEQLTAAALDVTVDDLTATRLRHARAAVLELSPLTLANTLEKKLSAQLKRAVEQTATDGANGAG